MKKIITFLLAGIFPLLLVAQSVNMQNGSYTVNCGTGATLYDNGGSGSNYSNSQSLTLTICPSAAGSFVTLNFSVFDVETSWDNLDIYNGSSTGSPLIQSYDNLNPPGVGTIQSTDASGCLTLYFYSDGSVNGNFQATIGCTQPCQTVQSVFDATTPSNDGIYTNACMNNTITFTTHGNYPQNGTGYVQSDATSTFHWDFGDGTTQDVNSTGTVTHTYTSAGIFDVDLRISDVNGCYSNNPLDKRVRISDTPIFNATANDVCLGDDVNLVANPIPTEIVMSPPSFVGDTVTLPDGVGVCYESTITYDIFDPADVITSGSDVLNICMNLEHTFVGDLGIYLECPDGTVIDLKTDIHSGGADFGAPPTPYEYCFTEIGPPANTVNDLSSGTTIPAGDYLPNDPFSDLIGCPLNGTWIVRICDNWASDDGTIFGWEMQLDPSLYGGVDNYTPTLDAGNWTGSNVNPPSTNPTTATPSNLGTETYTVTYVDEFGCPWDTSLTINVIGLDVTTAFTNPTCNGLCNGTASVTGVTGNVGALTYLWAGGNAAGHTTAAVTGLCAGTYTVTVTDGGASCTNVQTITLTNPPALTIALSQTPDNCGSGDGTVTVDITNGSVPIDYFWNGQETGSILNQADPYTIPGLSAGNYSITATDANTPGCSVIGSITVGTTGSVTAGFTASGNQCLEGNSFDFINTGSSGGTVTVTYDFIPPTSPAFQLTGPDIIGAIAGEAGVWTIIQTVQDGACSDQETLYVTVYDEPILTLTPTNVTCNTTNTGNPGPNGIITASVTNSNGSESYTIISGGGSFTPPSNTVATGLTANTYQVVVVDAMGCNDTATVVINEPAAIVLNMTSTQIQCDGDCTGDANVSSIVGGVGPFTYLWNNTQTTQTISNLCVGTYNVTVFDSNTPGNTCYEVGSQTILPVPAETYTSSSTTATCGLATGSATVNVTTVPASTSYTYTWYNNVALTGPALSGPTTTASTTNTLNNVAAGTYYVEVINANGCSDVVTIIVSDNGSPTLTVTNAVDILCNGGNNGQIDVSIGGTLNPNYTYTWLYNSNPYTSSNSSSTTDSQTGLLAGTYDISVLDNAGCIVTASVILSEPTALAGSITVVDANCSTPGSLTVNAANGTGPYTYQWDNDGTADVPASDPQTISVSTGVYHVTIYDVNLCELPLSATVNDIGGISSTAFVNDNAHCFGSSEGSITVTPIGAFGVVGYTWTPAGFTGQGTNTYSGLTAGTYTCVIVDANGCGATVSETITEPTPVVATFTDSTMVSCFNGSDGTITAGASGGTGGFTYQWDFAAGSQTNAQATGLQAGCYTVVAEDALGCTDDTSLCIHQPTQLIISVNEYDAHCDQSDGSASVNISGGTAPYPIINWSSGVPTANPDSVVGLPFGSYSVTVEDNNGCLISMNFNIDSIVRGTISISNYDSISCNGLSDGMIQVSVGGGGGSNNYYWDNGVGNVGANTQITGLLAGTYNVTATDVWGCELYASHTIYEPAGLTLSINSQNNICYDSNDGTATAIVGGGTHPYHYQWDDASLSTTASISGLSVGTYIVSVSDGHACTIIDSVYIAEPLAIGLTAVIDSSSCGQSDGAIRVTPINGIPPFAYLWSPNPTGSTGDTLVGIVQGNYCVTVTDFKGCTFDTCLIVMEQNAPIVQIDSIFNPLCNGNNDGIVWASATGGLQPYVWHWNSDSLGVLSTSDIATNLDGGNVCVTVTDDNGCQSTACTTLVENPPLNVIVNTVDVLCFGDSTGSASAIATGGTGLGTYTYQWNGLYSGSTPNNATDLGLPSGTYSVQVTDANSCQVLINNILINEPDHLDLTTEFSPVLCNGENSGSGTVHASGGEGTYIFGWNDPNTQSDSTASQLYAGEYTVTVTDGYGCWDTTHVIIPEPTLLKIDSVIYHHITCNGQCNGNISTYVSGGVHNYNFDYTGPGGFSNNAQTVFGLCNGGTYDILVTDANGCTVDTSIIIIHPTQLLAPFSSLDETCFSYEDGSINVTPSQGTPGYIVTWADANDTTNSRTDLAPGTYTYTVYDANGCHVSNNVVIDGNPELTLNLINGYPIPATCGNCDGEAIVQVTGGAGAPQITWFGGDFSDCSPSTVYPSGIHNSHQTGLPQGFFHAYVEDINGCRDTLDIAISNLNGPVIDDIVVTDVLCFGESTGTITATVSGGAGNLTYSWSNTSWVQQTTYQPAVSEGNYTFTVRDTNNCVNNVTVYVGENPQLGLNVINITDVTCNGGSDGGATIQGFGGTGLGTWTYEWSTSPTQYTQSVNNLQIGTYQAKIIDGNLCEATQFFTIDQPLPISLYSHQTTNTTCAYPLICDGVISVAPQGGAGVYSTYNWFGNGGNQNTIGGLCPGNYQLQVVDINGCTGDFNFSIGQPDTIKVTLGQDPIACADPNGMVWIETITGGTANTYVNSHPTNHDDVYPLGGSGAGWTCTWSVSGIHSAYVDGVYNQYYQVQVYDPANTQCSVTAGITVGSVPEPYLFSQQTTTTSCHGIDDGQVRIEVKQGTPDFMYSWALGSNVPFEPLADTVLISHIPAGTYQLTITDQNGCVVPTTFTIIEPSQVTVGTSAIPGGAICISQNAIVYANGSGGTPPYIYDWNNDDVFDEGSAVMLNPVEDTIVYVHIKDKNGCPANTQRVINVLDSLHMAMVQDGDICEGESFNLDVVYQNGGDGNYHYFWSIGSDEENFTITPTSTQTYFVTMSDECGSPVIKDSVKVIVNPNPYVQYISQKDSCEPLGMVFIPYPEDNDVYYTWNFGDPISGSNNISHNMYASHLFDHPGTYDITLSLISSENCHYDTTFANWITVYPLPEADFGMNPNPASLFNNTVTFIDITESGDPIDNIQWDFGNGESATFDYLNSHVKSVYDAPGYYNIVLFAETNHGCVDTARKVLRVNDEYTLYAPTAFTPGAGYKGINDYFYPIGHGIDSLQSYELVIYDRWGIEIFHTDVMPYGTDKRVQDFTPEMIPEEQRGWNGRYQNKGDLVQNDVYTWLVRLVDVNGVAHEASGKVVVIK
ncbi:MAG: PKD domain-containing protein [Bacteroidales bacterium]|nr:PKD domain-containing protein [Bacteroidales bacterium]